MPHSVGDNPAAQDHPADSDVPFPREDEKSPRRGRTTAAPGKPKATAGGDRDEDDADEVFLADDEEDEDEDEEEEVEEDEDEDDAEDEDADDDADEEVEEDAREPTGGAHASELTDDSTEPQGDAEPVAALAGEPEGEPSGATDPLDGTGPAGSAAALGYEPARRASAGSGWTIPLVCAGLAVLACCLLIPQADANRRLVYERQLLSMDLGSIEQQVTVNDEFLRKAADDPTLAQRLAQRQMRVVRDGMRVFQVRGQAGVTGSPFQLVAVDPPPALSPYEPVGGKVANLCYNPRSRLYLIGAGLTMVAAGLVLGSGLRT